MKQPATRCSPRVGSDRRLFRASRATRTQNATVAYVDRERWLAQVRDPHWYLELRDEYESLLSRARASRPDVRRRIADEVYSFFEDVLQDGSIALGDAGPDWDAERTQIDTVVIHHTGLPPGITHNRIDAIHLTRIYARYYADPAPAEAAIRGTPIFSGHYMNRRQVFYGYHWLIRLDGTAERLLADDQTGWQAGNWEVNCRSVGICLDGDFHAAEPPALALTALSELLRSSYPVVPPTRIFGHYEINPNTTCPGGLFSNWRATIAPTSGCGL